MSSIIRKADALLNEKPWLVFIFFTLLVVFLRWSSYYQSVIDRDESLYLLVAKAWSEGNPPYTVIWDNKPPGIYALFLIAISILGHSVLSIRILACLFVAITCSFIYKIGSLIENNGRGIGLLSGGLYAIATLSNGGMASNTEIFFATFVVIALYLFLFTHRHISEELFYKKNVNLFRIGLLLGIGFEIKYVVLFDFLALSLILAFTFVLRSRSKKKYWLILRSLFCLSLGFVLPFIIFSVYFWMNGHFNEYIYANFTANKLRTINIKFFFAPPLRAIFHEIRVNGIFWLCIPSVAIFLFIGKNIPARDRWILSSVIVWFISILVCICTVLRGSFYPHYFLQLSPYLCIVTAYIIINLVFSGTRVEQSEFRQYLIMGAILILLINTTDVFGSLNSTAKYVYFRHVKGMRDWGDTPRVIAEYLKPRIRPDEYIYLVNDLPIVYFLVDAKIPSRYAFHPFLLIEKDLPNITGVAPLEELDLILQKQPVYIIKRKTYTDDYYVKENIRFLNRLNHALDKSYRIEASIEEIDLFRLSSRP